MGPRDKAVLVSAIIPTFNAAASLRRAIKSVLSQTYEPLETIVVDDGSTDGTGQIMAAFGSAIVAIHQENEGVSAARNAGIKVARGEFIAFLDADDEWLPQKLERQIEFLTAHRDLGLLYSRMIRVNREGQEIGVIPKVGGKDTYPYLFHSNRIPTSSVMVQRGALHKAGGFDRSLRITQDYHLWLSIAADSGFAGLEETLARYWDHGAGLSSNVERRYREHLEILEKVPLRPDLGVDSKSRERAKAHYCYRLGRIAVRKGRPREAACWFAGVLKNPWCYGFWRHGPADHRVRYMKALRWYGISRLRALSSRK